MKIAIVAPSGPPDPHLLQKGIELLDERFGPLFFDDAPNIGLRAGYLAGDDEERIEGLRWAFEESDAPLVWFARGGYGATRIIESLPWKEWSKSGKTLLGYSDATAFLIAYSQAGGRAIHAPMIAADLARGGSSRSWESLEKIVFDHRNDQFEFDGEILNGEAVEGRIFAGNISVLAALAGTAFFPQSPEAVIFLEEVNEEPYRIDRALTQLKNAGLFRRADGIVFGSMTKCEAEEPQKSFTVDQLLKRFAVETGIPTVVGFPFGHGGENSVLPFGARLRIEKTVRIRATVSSN